MLGPSAPAKWRIALVGDGVERLQPRLYRVKVFFLRHEHTVRSFTGRPERFSDGPKVGHAVWPVLGRPRRSRQQGRVPNGTIVPLGAGLARVWPSLIASSSRRARRRRRHPVTCARALLTPAPSTPALRQSGGAAATHGSRGRRAPRQNRQSTGITRCPNVPPRPALRPGGRATPAAGPRAART